MSDHLSEQISCDAHVTEHFSVLISCSAAQVAFTTMRLLPWLALHAVWTAHDLFLLGGHLLCNMASKGVHYLVSRVHNI